MIIYGCDLNDKKNNIVTLCMLHWLAVNVIIISQQSLQA